MTAPTDRPWHQPGKWLVNPAYWEDEAKAARPRMRKRIQFIDCTVSEGDDCVGHQLNWNTRLGVIDRHVELGTEVISPIFKWKYEDTISDFGGALSKQAIVDAIHESIAYMKQYRVRVVPWMEDSMRANLDTACLFYGAMAKAGADGVYTVDSRGNSTPLATRVYIGRIREAVGDNCDVYVQHHNDLGVATANAMAAVEAGASWIDASVIGIGDRGGCVALEEAAALFEMYGIGTGIRLDGLYELCKYVQQAYGVALPPWKPIVGANWNKEEGAGHLEGSADAEATIGIAPRVVGREFEAVIGGKVLFGRERSSAHTDDPVMLRDLMKEWGYAPTDPQFQTVLTRARAAVATNYGRHYLTFDEFRAICAGVMQPPHEERR